MVFSMNKEILEAVLEKRGGDNKFVKEVIDKALVDKAVEAEKAEKAEKTLKELNDYIDVINDHKADMVKQTAKSLAKEAKGIKQDQVSFLGLFLKEFCDSDSYEPTWKIDSALNELISTMGIEIIDPCIKLYEGLVDKGHTEDNPYDFNDMDNKLFYLEIDPIWYEDSLVSDRKAFVFKGQSYSWLIVIDGSKFSGTKLHIRQFNDDYDPELPTLMWYKDIGCTLDISSQVSHEAHMGIKHSGYGDCRDKGYILSVSNSKFGHSDKYNYYKAKFAIEQLRWAISEFSLECEFS